MKKFTVAVLVIISVILNSTAEEEDSSEYGIKPGAKKTSCPCGHLNKNQGRILDGAIAGPNEFPFMVGIKTTKSPFIFCGGAIISAFHVLTAAHCTEPRSYEKFVVVAGDNNPYDPEDNGHVAEYNVKKVIEHELFDLKAELEYDIALLVTEKIAFDQYIAPICFPTEQTNIPGEIVTILGWGRISPNGPYSDNLRKANLKIIDLATCDKYHINIDDSEFCTRAFEGAADACQGDTGAPVIWRDPDTNRYTLVGLLSFGELCKNIDEDSNVPSVNTNIYYHTEWIKQKMAESRPNGRTCSKI